MTLLPDPPSIEPRQGCGQGFVERRRTYLRFESDLLDAMSDAVLVTDRDQRITSWNRAAEEIYGWSREEAIGQVLDAFLGTEFPETTRQAVEDRLSVTTTWKGLVQQRHKLGEPRFLEASVSVLEEGGGEAGRVSVNRDVTQSRQEEQAHRDHEHRWRAALEGTNEGIWDWNTITDKVYYSPRWKAMLGYLPEEIGDSLEEWSSRVHPDDLAGCFADLRAHFRGDTAHYQHEHRVRCRDGSYRWILDRGKVFEWESEGKPSRVIGTHQDITERKETEAALQASEARLALALEATTAGVWDWNFAENQIYRSRNGWSMVGLEPEALAADPDRFWELVHPEDLPRIKANLAKVIQGPSDSFSASFRLRHSEGHYVPVLSQGKVQRDAEGKAVRLCGITSDQTLLRKDLARKELENAALESILQGRRFGDLFQELRTGLQALHPGVSVSLLGPDPEPPFEAAESGPVSLVLSPPEGPGLEEDDRAFLKRCEALANLASQRQRDRRKMEKATSLLERTGRLAQVGGWQLLVETGHQYWSDEMFSIHDLEPGQPPTLEEAIRYFPPEARAAYAAALEACLSGGQSWDLELPMRTAKGRLLWVHTQGFAEQQGGRTVGITGALQDITQKAKAERSLEASETLHRTLVEILSEGVLVFNDKGVCITANEQACRIIGAAREELLFKSPAETPPYRFQLPAGRFLEGDDLPLQACRTRGTVTRDLLLRLVRPGASSAWILLNVRPLDPSVALGHRSVVVSFTDITASHEAEQARLESLLVLEELRSAINQSVIFARTDLAGRILEVNDEFIRISGYSREELIGANHRILKSGTHPDAFYREMWRTITEGRIWRGEIQNRAKDGHLYWVLSTIIPMHHPNGRPKGYMIFRQDVTEQHELQGALLQSQKLESVGTLVAGIAHDFNNILMSIGGFAEVLSAAPGLTPAQSKGLEVIRRAGNRGRVLVTKLLNFSRKNAPQMTQSDVNGAVQETAQLFKRGLAERIRLTVSLAPQLPTTRMDLDQIHQVLMNLCVNAKDAILGEGEITLATGLEDLSPDQAIALSLPLGSYLYAVVRDTGQGIPDRVLTRMFEPFFTTKGIGKGTGLGLSVVHGIVRSHGGAIEVDSQLGKGSVFKVYLPLLEAREELEMAPVEVGSRGRVMVVTSGEDLDPGVGELLSALRFELMKMDQSEEWGSRIDWSDAVLLFLETDVDWASARIKLGQGPTDVPIILLTPMKDSSTRIPVLQHPISAVLASPPRRGELVDTLNSLVPPQGDR
jgi:PAS domain S-box-containing protein